MPGKVALSSTAATLFKRTALSIAPTGDWKGNDGTWSTFYVNISTPAQSIQVFPATSQSEIAVVLAQGCSSFPDLATCPALRGQLFDPATDGSWVPFQAANGDFFFQMPFLSEQTLPNYDASCEVGNDTLTLDWNGKSAPTAPLQNQSIVGYAASNPWIGMLGLSGRPTAITSSTDTHLSPLQTLQQNGNIKGLSWGYTAATSSSNPPTFGSLTLGGYDATRMSTSTALFMPFSANTSRDLSVAVIGITMTTILDAKYSSTLPF